MGQRFCANEFISYKDKCWSVLLQQPQKGNFNELILNTKSLLLLLFMKILDKCLFPQDHFIHGSSSSLRFIFPPVEIPVTLPSREMNLKRFIIVIQQNYGNGNTDLKNVTQIWHWREICVKFKKNIVFFFFVSLINRDLTSFYDCGNFYKFETCSPSPSFSIWNIISEFAGFSHWQGIRIYMSLLFRILEYEKAVYTDINRYSQSQNFTSTWKKLKTPEYVIIFEPLSGQQIVQGIRCPFFFLSLFLLRNKAYVGTGANWYQRKICRRTICCLETNSLFIIEDNQGYTAFEQIQWTPLL